jgi:pimeloyl-ACP methyl ester carboxylesterase
VIPYDPAMSFDPHHRGGDGTPMVLLHGFTDTWRCWTRVLPALKARHSVFAPTLPGHAGGESFEDSASMTMPIMVDKIERQLDAHGIERAHLVGSSLGGWLSLELAARGRALSVVGVCPAGGWDGMTRELRATLRYFQRNELMMRYARPLLRTTAARPRARRLALRDVIADPSSVTAAEAMMMFEGAAECAIVQDAIRLTRTQQMFGDLAHIDAPVRVLYGTRDRIVRWPNAYVRMRRMLPEAEFVALSGLGHLPMWEAPELVTRLILEVTDPAEMRANGVPVALASTG